MTAALGGVCIEKHYTIDKRLPDVPDHAMSVDPAELAEMVGACRRAARSARRRRDRRPRLRAPARDNARRSIVLERDVEAGVPLQAEDLGFKRPGIGIPPFEAPAVVGRKLREPGRRGLTLLEEHLQP